MHEALEELRAKLNGDRIDMAELVIIGARAKARGLGDQSQKARQARKELAEWILTGTGPKLDIAAAEEVKHLGLIPNYDE